MGLLRFHHLIIRSSCSCGETCHSFVCWFPFLFLVRIYLGCTYILEQICPESLVFKTSDGLRTGRHWLCIIKFHQSAQVHRYSKLGSLYNRPKEIHVAVCITYSIIAKLGRLFGDTEILSLAPELNLHHRSRAGGSAHYPDSKSNWFGRQKHL
jgi:hypothetical protein